MNDWAQLYQYNEANTKIIPPAEDEYRVVFFGDSITNNWDLEFYFPQKPYINRGINGQTTPQMLIRFRPDVIALKPCVVVILAGTNDIADNTGLMTAQMIQDNLVSIAELARANKIRVVFSSVLPIHDDADRRSVNRPPEKIKELNEWIKSYCEANNHVYLNYFDEMIDETEMLKKELADDGLHPNSAGYEVMTPLAKKAIEEALKR